MNKILRKLKAGLAKIKKTTARFVQLTNPKRVTNYTRQFLPDAGPLLRFRILIDYYICLIVYGTIVNDYFEYRFWEKRACVRRTYMTTRSGRAFVRKMNPGPVDVLRYKEQFNEFFKEFRGLKTFHFEDGDLDAFREFVDACGGKIIAKPKAGMSGQGIYLPDVSTEEKTKAVYEELKEGGEYFTEELFVQEGPLHEICPASVNTVRIFSVFTKGETVITFAGARFGGGVRCVDNIHGGGMRTEVDLESGRIISRGYNVHGGVFLVHPVTKAFILGVQVPMWKEVCAAIKKAHAMIPEIRYVAWDVAISTDRFCFIEGNDHGNFDGTQICMGRGCKADYMQYLEG